MTQKTFNVQAQTLIELASAIYIAKCPSVSLEEMEQLADVAVNSAKQIYMSVVNLIPEAAQEGQTEE